jgi:hypothetical protein
VVACNRLIEQPGASTQLIHSKEVGRVEAHGGKAVTQVEQRHTA